MSNPNEPIKPRYVTRLEQVRQLNDREKAELKPVCDKFLIRANEYYLGLIDWDDPADPIRRIIMPSCEELETWGDLDPSDEARYTPARGLEHKYADTALMLVNDVCGGYCRFCFRKRIFLSQEAETVRHVDEALDYIVRHREITNVLLTGGDPLLLSTRKLTEIVSRLRGLDHVEILRIGSKMPAFNPYRIVQDEALLEMFRTYSTPAKRIYVMTHFNHPNELTRIALEAIDRLLASGAILCNQTPLLRGINDDPDTLRELFRKLSFAGVSPYYIFQCRPTVGNMPYAIPVEEGYAIFREAQVNCSGVAKRARYAMSHASGKVVVAGMDEDHIYFRYHRAANPLNDGRLMALRRNSTAYWLDDYDEAADWLPGLADSAMV